MTITVPENTFKKPTEVRENVVQAIVNAFVNYKLGTGVFELCPYGYSTFVRTIPGQECFVTDSEDGRATRFHECEMDAAVASIKKAGWHLFKRMYHNPRREWPGYKFFANPENPGWSGAWKVDSITEHWD